MSRRNLNNEFKNSISGVVGNSILFHSKWECWRRSLEMDSWCNLFPTIGVESQDGKDPYGEIRIVRTRFSLEMIQPDEVSEVSPRMAVPPLVPTWRVGKACGRCESWKTTFDGF